MKRQISLLAICLTGVGFANAQTTTNTYSSSSTTTNSSYSTTPTTTGANTTVNGNYSTSPTSTTDGSGSTMSTNTVNTTGSMTDGTTTNGTVNSTGTLNNGTTTYGTTTTTTSSDYNSADRKSRRDNDKPWGKEGKFGVYAGVNFSRFVNEPIPDGAYRAGWQAGIYGRSGGTLFGQIGLEYRNSTSGLVRNGTNQPTQPVSEIRGNIDQHFLAIPAYVGVRVGSALGLRLQVGAELASLVAVGSNNFSLGKDDLNRTILNGLAGAGINLGPLTLDAVYNLGLQNVFDNADTKRRMLALNVGFRF